MSVLGPGSLVRCVDDTRLRWPPHCSLEPLVAGRMYRVRDTHSATDRRTGVEVGAVSLLEYPRVVRDTAGMRWHFRFDARRFVPVDDGAIDVFRDLLAPVPRERTKAREKEKA